MATMLTIQSPKCSYYKMSTIYFCVTEKKCLLCQSHLQNITKHQSLRDDQTVFAVYRVYLKTLAYIQSFDHFIIHTFVNFKLSLI